MRGMWCRAAATDEQLQWLHKDGVMPKLERVVQELAKHEKMPGLCAPSKRGGTDVRVRSRRPPPARGWVSDEGIGTTQPTTFRD